jgi:hypothetical protein
MPIFTGDRVHRSANALGPHLFFGSQPVFDSNRRLEMAGPTTDQTQDIIDRHAQKKRAEIHEIVQVELAKWRAAGSPELNPNADMPQGVWDKETEVAVKSAIIAEQLQNQQAAIDAEQAIRQEQM